MDATDLSEQEKLDRLRLIRSENVGPITFRHLLNKFGTAAEAIKAIPELAKSGGRKKPLKLHPKSQTEKEWAALETIGGSFLIYEDKDYPTLLSHTEGAPPVLAFRGDKSLIKKRSIGIVGGRNASLNGKKLAFRFAEMLGQEDFVITSGLARGIDTASHEGSIHSGTIAILAGGVDVIYPKENARLYERLCEEGAVLSEMPLGSKPQARHFPRRNRIISGLSEGVLVIEAALKSGSLITARYALEQNRDVFSVPGSPMDARSRGCNNLIRNAAILTETPADIISELNRDNFLRTLNFSNVSPTAPQSQNPDHPENNDYQIRILNLLGYDPITLDEISRELDTLPAKLTSVIVELELAGKIERHSGNRISLC